MTAALAQQVSDLNAKVEALLAMMGSQRKPRGRKKVDSDVLLSSSAAAEAAISTEKPHLRVPTWTYLGQGVTSVWPLLDVIGGSQGGKVKTVAHIKKHGIGWMTVGHKAHSDEGTVDIHKVGAETLYAPVEAIVDAVEAASPRAGKKLVATFRARYA